MKPITSIKSLCLATIAGIALLASCGPVKDITYFQNKVLNQPEKIDKHAGIVIQPNDMISIVVSSRNPELAAMFNLTGPRGGQELIESDGAGSSNASFISYLVDKEGCIDFPVLGQLKVAGLTRNELSEMIKKRLLKDGLLNDAVVTVDFKNFKVSVMGEVNSPGVYPVTGDRITVLEAISMAGDLTIYGLRENVTVMREINGERIFYNINLCGVDMFKSPAYYLEQNDVVYVEMRQQKAKESTLDNRTIRVVSIVTSSASLIVTLINLAVSIVGKYQK